MSSKAKSGYATMLKIGNGASPEVFSTIAEITAIDPPGNVPDVIEVSNMDSPATGGGQGMKEYILGMIDAQEISGTANFVYDSTQAQLLTDLQAGTRRNFQITVPSQTPKTMSFSAFIVMWNPKTPLKGAITLDFKLRVTGLVTIS